ncbi:UNVERIFIED_CONTAM: hypothetical protein FKN15_027384 [Acipenser sinensis]
MNGAKVREIQTSKIDPRTSGSSRCAGGQERVSGAGERCKRIHTPLSTRSAREEHGDWKRRDQGSKEGSCVDLCSCLAAEDADGCVFSPAL